MARKARTPSRSELVDPRLKDLDVQELMDRREQSRQNRIVWEQDWWLNLSYFNGDQSVSFVVDSGKIIHKEVSDAYDTTVFNIILPVIRTQRAKLHKTGAYPEVLPSRDNDDAIAAAKISEAYLTSEMRRWIFPRKFRQSTFWLSLCGNVFFKWIWDTEAKRPELDVLSPFEVFWDPFGRTFEDCRWAIHERFMSQEEAWDLYQDLPGADLSFLELETGEPLNQLSTRIFSDVSIGSTNLQGCVVREYFEKPTKAKPEGEFIVFTQSGIVYRAKKYPFPHGEIPITHAGDITRSSSKYHASIVDYLREPQDTYNRRESLIEENLHVSASGKWWISEAMDLEEDPSAEPRQVLKSRASMPPGVEPKYIQPAPLPAWVVQDATRVEQYMYEMAGQHEVSRGGVPGRLDSAQGLAMAQESDDAVTKDPIHSLEEAFAAGFMQIMKNAKSFAPAEQMVKVYDTNGLAEVLEFKKNDIDLDATINVRITTSLPTTIAGKFDRVLNLVQYQVIRPEQAAKLLDLSIEDPDIDPAAEGRRRQHSENLKMAESLGGSPDDAIVPHIWQNHPAHLEELEKFMNSEKFIALEHDVQMLFVFHHERHQALQEQVAAYEGRLALISQGQINLVQPIESTPADQDPPLEGTPQDPTAPPPGGPVPPDGSGGPPPAPGNAGAGGSGPPAPDGRGPAAVTDAVP